MNSYVVGREDDRLETLDVESRDDDVGQGLAESGFSEQAID